MAMVTPFLSEVLKDNDDELQPLRITTTSEIVRGMFLFVRQVFLGCVAQKFHKAPSTVCV